MFLAISPDSPWDFAFSIIGIGMGLICVLVSGIRKIQNIKNNRRDIKM